jgi:hypothetical protein
MLNVDSAEKPPFLKTRGKPAKSVNHMMLQD